MQLIMAAMMEHVMANLGAPSSRTKKLLDTRKALLAANGTNPYIYNRACGIRLSEQPNSVSDVRGNVSIKIEHRMRNTVDTMSAADM